MAAISALCTLTQAKAWLGLTNSDSDVVLGGLIVAVSQTILGYLNRSIFPATHNEIRDGSGSQKLMLSEWPVLSISALALNGTAIAADAQAPQGSGYFLVPADPLPPGRMQPLILYGGGVFCKGFGNVAVTYFAGYVVADEAWPVPTTPFQIQPAAPYGDWNSDQGVSYANGTPLIPVPSGPAAGQYSVSATGLYTFAAADAGAAVLISYGYTPAGLRQAAIEAVGERFRAKDRIGVNSKTLAGQETISYTRADLSQPVKMMLAPFGRVVSP